MKLRSLASALFSMVVLLALFTLPVLADAGRERTLPRWTLEDVLGSDQTPFVIGHRGYGENLGEDPDRPIENTTESVRRAFREGVQIVEVDVVLTKDDRAVALHDDFLGDLTCVNSMDLQELRHRLKDVSPLRQILQIARTFSYERNTGRPGGLVIIEIKTPSPLCDPEDVSVPRLVRAVLDDIAHTHMADQVLLESFSPEILAMARSQDPRIPLMLSLSVLQLLTPEEIERLTGLPVRLIDKDAGFGLQWAEIGVFYRLPGYDSIFQYLNTLILTDSRSAALDKIALAQMEQYVPGFGSQFIEQLHLSGMEALVYTIDTAPEWYYFSSLGADGIYTNDVPMGLMLEGR